MRAYRYTATGTQLPAGLYAGTARLLTSTAADCAAAWFSGVAFARGVKSANLSRLGGSRLDADYSLRTFLSDQVAIPQQEGQSDWLKYPNAQEGAQ